ncbi:MAG: transcriptional activator NhaR [Pseudomonadota bacterium]
MRQLNYNHLHYFWAIAREGSMASAAKKLHITPQTISGQLRLLEDAIGQALFNRVGRRLELTEMGQTVYQYADEIFAIGSELASVVAADTDLASKRLRVGIVSSMPKIISERVLGSVLQRNDGAISLHCQESELPDLLFRLNSHKLDLVLSDQPIPDGLNVRAFNHKLGESDTSFFVSRTLINEYGKPFPLVLDQAPMLMPTKTSALRRRLDDWLELQRVTPIPVAEIDDSAMLKAFGEAGRGIFAAPSVIEQEICRMYNAIVIGRTGEITEHYYVISPHRKVKHPATLQIIESARSELFIPRDPESHQRAG